MQSRISIDSQIHFGKPCIARTRIPIENVLELVRAAIPPEEIRRDFYPDVTDEDIQACVDYAMQEPRRGDIL